MNKLNKILNDIFTIGKIKDYLHCAECEGVIYHKDDVDNILTHITKDHKKYVQGLFFNTIEDLEPDHIRKILANTHKLNLKWSWGVCKHNAEFVGFDGGICLHDITREVFISEMNYLDYLGLRHSKSLEYLQGMLPYSLYLFYSTLEQHVFNAIMKQQLGLNEDIHKLTEWLDFLYDAFKTDAFKKS